MSTDLYSSTFEALASVACLLKRDSHLFDEAKGFRVEEGVSAWLN